MLMLLFRIRKLMEIKIFMDIQYIFKNAITKLHTISIKAMGNLGVIDDNHDDDDVEVLRITMMMMLRITMMMMLRITMMMMLRIMVMMMMLKITMMMMLRITMMMMLKITMMMIVLDTCSMFC